MAHRLMPSSNEIKGGSAARVDRMAEKAIDPGILASRRYWAEREEENRRATIRDEKEYAKGIREVLEKEAANIQKEIDAFYGRYAAREGITISDAKMRVSTLDIKEYSRKAKQYVADKDFSKQANEEMRIYNLTMKINRLEMLKSNIGLELCASYSELENYFEDSLTKTARKEFRRQAGILGGTVANMEKHAGEIVNGSFRGAKFSERLWANQAYLKTQLDNLLRTGLIQGRNPRELAKSLRKEIETSVYVSERLMRTEMCRVQIGAQLASYQNMGYDKLVIIPEHDERSCDYCETQDGVIVEVAKAVPGVNVPPFHPNCRCSTSAWVEDLKESTSKRATNEERIDWPLKGETISEEEFKKVRQYAANKGIRLSGVKKSDVDTAILRDVIDKTAEVIKKYDLQNRMPEIFTIYVNSRMRSVDFAESFPGVPYIIHLNADAYRDAEALKKEYQERENGGFFVKGTDFRSIPYHEMGHIIGEVYGIDSLEIAKSLLQIDGEKELLTKVKSVLSEYASKSGGEEIIAESYSAVLSGVNNEFALMFVKECDKIISKRR